MSTKAKQILTAAACVLAIAASGLPGSGTILLPVDAERVIILAPRQSLFATCLVIGRVTLMASDALPIV